MKMTVTKDELKTKFSIVQGITGKGSTMPILSHCLLTARKEGSTITATDLTISMRENLAATVEAEGAICVPSRKIYEIVTESEGDIVLETNTDDTWLEIRSGKSRFKLSCLPAKEFPAWPGIKDGRPITFRSADLAEMIAKTIYAAGETDTRYTLNGLLFHMQPQAGKVTIVGTDGHRLATLDKAIDLAGWEETKAIVPKKALTELGKLMDDKGEVSCSMGKSHILFQFGDVSLMATLIEGTYPNYDTIIPARDSNPNTVHVNRAVFMKAVKKVSVMAREGTKAITVEIVGKNMAVSSSNPEMGDARDEIPVEYDGQEQIRTGFNAKYLLDAASAFTTENMTFSFATAFAPVLLTNNGNRNYLGIIMPMRI